MMGCLCLQTVQKEPPNYPFMYDGVFVFANGSKGAPNYPFMYDGVFVFANGSKGAPNHPFMYDGVFVFANKQTVQRIPIII